MSEEEKVWEADSGVPTADRRTAGLPKNTGLIGLTHEGLSQGQRLLHDAHPDTIVTLTGAGAGAISTTITSRGSAFTPPIDAGRRKPPMHFSPPLTFPPPANLHPP